MFMILLVLTLIQIIKLISKRTLKKREEWILDRNKKYYSHDKFKDNITQLTYAKNGIITKEMEYVAARESSFSTGLILRLLLSLFVSEIESGRAIIPSNSQASRTRTYDYW